MKKVLIYIMVSAILVALAVLYVHVKLDRLARPYEVNSTNYGAIYYYLNFPYEIKVNPKYPYDKYSNEGSPMIRFKYEFEPKNTIDFDGISVKYIESYDDFIEELYREYDVSLDNTKYRNKQAIIGGPTIHEEDYWNPIKKSVIPEELSKYSGDVKELLRDEFALGKKMIVVTYSESYNKMNLVGFSDNKDKVIAKFNFQRRKPTGLYGAYPHKEFYMIYPEGKEVDVEVYTEDTASADVILIVAYPAIALMAYFRVTIELIVKYIIHSGGIKKLFDDYKKAKENYSDLDMRKEEDSNEDDKDDPIRNL